MLLENKTNEQIASELKISVRSVQNYNRKLEQRYMAYQNQNTDDTMFLECNLLKNRLLTLYNALQTQVTSDLIKLLELKKPNVRRSSTKSHNAITFDNDYDDLEDIKNKIKNGCWFRLLGKHID
jgi:hypothetical protein